MAGSTTSQYRAVVVRKRSWQTENSSDSHGADVQSDVRALDDVVAAGVVGGLDVDRVTAGAAVQHGVRPSRWRGCRRPRGWAAPGCCPTRGSGRPPQVRPPRRAAGAAEVAGHRLQGDREAHGLLPAHACAGWRGRGRARPAGGAPTRAPARRCAPPARRTRLRPTPASPARREAAARSPEPARRRRRARAPGAAAPRTRSRARRRTPRRRRPSVMSTCSSASMRALSVPGSTGSHSVPSCFAVSVRRGSMTTTGTPRRFASRTRARHSQPMMQSTRLAPQRTIIAECRERRRVDAGVAACPAPPAG